MNPLSLKPERFVVAAYEADGAVQGFGQLAPLGGAPQGGPPWLELRSLIVDPDHRWALAVWQLGISMLDVCTQGLQLQPCQKRRARPCSSKQTLLQQICICIGVDRACAELVRRRKNFLICIFNAASSLVPSFAGAAASGTGCWRSWSAARRTQTSS